MIDETGVDNTVDVVAVSSEPTVDAAASDSGLSQGQGQTLSEKTLTQSEVNKIVSAVKAKSFNKGLEAAMSGQGNSEGSTAVIANSNQHQNNVPQQQGQPNIEQTIDARVNQRLEELQRQQAELIAKQQQEAAVAQVEGQLKQKMEDARKGIDGYDESLAKVGNFHNFPGLKYAASQAEHGGKILHYLANNPHEIPLLESMATSFTNADGTLNPAPLLSEFKRISDRISLNENSEKYKSIPNPVSQIETNTRGGIGDGTPNSISDFRKLFKG